MSWRIGCVVWICGALWWGCQPPVVPHDELIILKDPDAQVSREGPSDASSPVERRAEADAEPQPEDAKLPEPLVPEPSPEPSPEPRGSEPRPSPEPRPGEPPTGQKWIGEACTDDAQCGYPGGHCLKQSQGYPGGSCSKDCSSTCPDRPGKATTFCIAGPGGKGICVSQCAAGCRTSYACETRSRLGASVQKRVCVPQRSTPTGGKKVLYIGDSQSSGSKFAGVMVGFLRDPKAQCPSASTGKSAVHSYARVSSAARHWSEPSGSSKDWLCRQTKIWTNGTAASDTTGPKLCAGITGTQTSIFQKLIQQHKPNAFLIQLGGNSIGFSQSYVKSRVKRMLDLMPQGSLCFWVTPSYGTKSLSKRRDAERWIREEIQAYTRIRCAVLTSIDEMSKQTTCSSFNAPDGIHMTSCGSQLWGQLILSKICKHGSL